MAKVVLSNLEEAKAVLHKIIESDRVSSPNWPVFTIMSHCAQTIQYAMTGYPKSKPKWIQNTIGKWVLGKFSRQGYMSHNLQAPVPGSPPIENTGIAKDGIKILLNTIETFETYRGELKPHLIFGNLSKEAYNQYFAMHIADHLSEVSY